MQLLSCRSDCVSLLEKCLIKDPHDASKNAERICMILMPNPDQTDCITSSEYIEAKKGLSSQLVDGSVIFSDSCFFLQSSTSNTYLSENEDN